MHAPRGPESGSPDRGGRLKFFGVEPCDLMVFEAPRAVGGGRWEVSGERGNQPQCSPKRTAELSSTSVFEMALWRG